MDVPPELTALSNMPVVEEKINENVKTVVFEESPPMSTYLVAVVVGLFEHIEDTTADGMHVTFIQDSIYLLLFLKVLTRKCCTYVIYMSIAGIKVRLYCALGKSEKGRYALSLAVMSLDLYSK